MSNFDLSIAFIGAGNMAKSIINGLVARGYPSAKIRVSAPSRDRLAELEAVFGVVVSCDNTEIVAGAQVVVLAVKPQVMKSVCIELCGHVGDETLIMSLAAGVGSSFVQHWLGRNCAIVRCMSNTPAQVLAGASALFANPSVSPRQRDVAAAIMEAVGLVCWLDDESLMDNVTAVAGSGPAYFFLFLEAMIDTAVAEGLKREDATRLAIQTALGAAKLAQESQDDLRELRRKVTSPGGTTERAIASFENDHLRSTVARAMAACVERARELGAQC